MKLFELTYINPDGAQARILRGTVTARDYVR
jgi:hypothetical protein